MKRVVSFHLQTASKQSFHPTLSQAKLIVSWFFFLNSKLCSVQVQCANLPIHTCISKVTLASVRFIFELKTWAQKIRGSSEAPFAAGPQGMPIGLSAKTSFRCERVFREGQQAWHSCSIGSARALAKSRGERDRAARGCLRLGCNLARGGRTTSCNHLSVLTRSQPVKSRAVVASVRCMCGIAIRSSSGHLLLRARLPVFFSFLFLHVIFFFAWQ